jgi:hypothetical protein
MSDGIRAKNWRPSWNFVDGALTARARFRLVLVLDDQGCPVARARIT